MSQQTCVLMKGLLVGMKSVFDRKIQTNIMLIKDISTVHRKRDSIRHRKENIMEERKEHQGLNHRYFQHNLVKVLWSRGFNWS